MGRPSAFAEVGAQLAASGDLLTQARWRGVRARVLARRHDVQATKPLSLVRPSR